MWWACEPTPGPRHKMSTSATAVMRKRPCECSHLQGWTGRWRTPVPEHKHGRLNRAFTTPTKLAHSSDLCLPTPHPICHFFPCWCARPFLRALSHLAGENVGQGAPTLSLNGVIGLRAQHGCVGLLEVACSWQGGRRHDHTPAGRRRCRQQLKDARLGKDVQEAREAGLCEEARGGEGRGGRKPGGGAEKV